jgi:hypothetical protein
MVFQVAKAAEDQNQDNPELSVRTPASPPAARGDGGFSLDFGVYPPTDPQAPVPASLEGSSSASLPFVVYPSQGQPPPQVPNAEPAGAASTAGPVGGVQSPLRSSQRKTRPVDVLKGSALAAPAHRKKAKDNAGGAGPSSPKKAKPTDDPVSPEMPSATATRLRQKEAGEAAGSPPSKSRKQKDRRKAHYEKK